MEREREKRRGEWSGEAANIQIRKTRDEEVLAIKNFLAKAHAYTI